MAGLCSGMDNVQCPHGLLALGQQAMDGCLCLQLSVFVLCYIFLCHWDAGVLQPDCYVIALQFGCEAPACLKVELTTAVALSQLSIRCGFFGSASQH
jgi:hypothetical protein